MVTWTIHKPHIVHLSQKCTFRVKHKDSENQFKVIGYPTNLEMLEDVCQRLIDRVPEEPPNRNHSVVLFSDSRHLDLVVTRMLEAAYAGERNEYALGR